MRQHAFQPCLLQIHRNLLVPLLSLWTCKISIKVSHQQQFGSSMALSKRYDSALDIRGVVGGKVTSDYVLSPIPHRQLRSDGFGAKLMYHLHQEPQGLLVQHHHSTVVLSWRVCINDAVSGRPAGVDSISELGFLEDA